jgi:hypothetical protein
MTGGAPELVELCVRVTGGGMMLLKSQMKAAAVVDDDVVDDFDPDDPDVAGVGSQITLER